MYGQALRMLEQGMSGEAAEIARTQGQGARSGSDKAFGHVDRRFRLLFALASIALVVINVAVALTVLYQQRQMRDSALALYDRAFVANNDMNNARVLFQRFADQREST
jgi:hypothetical protein